MSRGELRLEASRSIYLNPSRSKVMGIPFCDRTSYIEYPKRLSSTGTRCVQGLILGTQQTNYCAYNNDTSLHFIRKDLQYIKFRLYLTIVHYSLLLLVVHLVLADHDGQVLILLNVVFINSLLSW